MYFSRKKSESPEIRFLWHFQKAKKVAIKTVMAIKTVAIKTVMDCIVTTSVVKCMLVFLNFRLGGGSFRCNIGFFKEN